jgi:hypothetical protein
MKLDLRISVEGYDGKKDVSPWGRLGAGKLQAAPMGHVWKVVRFILIARCDDYATNMYAV